MGHYCLDEANNVNKRRLLIAQSNELLRRALRRYLLRYFSKIFTAANPSDAEAVLRNVEHEITDLICGQDFGIEWPRGTDLIATWRPIYPSLRRVVLFTAIDDIPAELPGVDAVWRKPLEPSAMYAALINA